MALALPKRALDRYRERRIRALNDDENSNRRYERDIIKPETVSRPKTFDFLFEEKLKREVLEAVSRCLEREEKEENADDEKSSGMKSSNSEKSEKTHHHPEDGNNNSGFKVGPRRKKLEAKKRVRAEQALEMKNNKRKEEEAEEVVFCTIADIGCGDGYWLEKISRWLVFGENDEVVSPRERARKRNVRFRFIGIDASKEAVRVAETNDDNYYCC